MMSRSLYMLIVSMALICSCASEQKRIKNNRREFPVIRLASKDTFINKTYVANIQAIRNVEMRNKISGYLERIHVDEGQAVKKGQLLFSINADEFETEVSKAEAMLGNALAEAKGAEVQLGRVRLLVEKDIISSTELELANANLSAQKAKIREAQSQVKNANTKLLFAYIRAPFDGIINRIPFREGSLLNEGSLLTTVSDIESVFAYFNIGEGEYLQYLRDKMNHPTNGYAIVNLLLADGSKYRHEGRVETTTSEFEQGTGSIAFRAKFPNPQKILMHGATGEILLASSLEDALLLPQKAAFEIQDKNYVFVMDTANIVKMKSFIPKARIDEYYIVQSGLEEGDMIVYEGTQNLKNGMEIIPKEVHLPELKANTAAN